MANADHNQVWIQDFRKGTKTRQIAISVLRVPGTKRMTAPVWDTFFQEHPLFRQFAGQRPLVSSRRGEGSCQNKRPKPKRVAPRTTMMPTRLKYRWVPLNLNKDNPTSQLIRSPLENTKTRVLISIKAARPNYTSSSSHICNPNLSYSHHK